MDFEHQPCWRCMEQAKRQAAVTSERKIPASAPQIDYKAIAAQAVDLLCRVGMLGLHPGQQRRLWQVGLDLDRKLNPHRARTIVWTEDEGDIDPPRREDGRPLPVVEFS